MSLCLIVTISKLTPDVATAETLDIIGLFTLARILIGSAKFCL